MFLQSLYDFLFISSLSSFNIFITALLKYLSFAFTRLSFSDNIKMALLISVIANILSIYIVCAFSRTPTHLFFHNGFLLWISDDVLIKCCLCVYVFVHLSCFSNLCGCQVMVHLCSAWYSDSEPLYVDMKIGWKKWSCSSRDSCNSTGSWINRSGIKTCRWTSWLGGWRRTLQVWGTQISDVEVLQILKDKVQIQKFGLETDPRDPRQTGSWDDNQH